MTATSLSTSRASRALHLRRLLLVSFLFEVVGYALDQRLGVPSGGVLSLRPSAR